jgi:DNA-binding response OmpR family regulator
MDVLIIERDELIGSMLAETLDAEGISVAVVSDEDALKLASGDAPQVMGSPASTAPITRI